MEQFIMMKATQILPQLEIFSGSVTMINIGGYANIIGREGPSGAWKAWWNGFNYANFSLKCYFRSDYAYGGAISFKTRFAEDKVDSNDCIEFKFEHLTNGSRMVSILANGIVLGSATHGSSEGLGKIRILAIDNVLKAKFWSSGNPPYFDNNEPSTWDVSVVSSHNADKATTLQIFFNNTNTAGGGFGTDSFVESALQYFPAKIITWGNSKGNVKIKTAQEVLTLATTTQEDSLKVGNLNGDLIFPENYEGVYKLPELITPVRMQTANGIRIWRKFLK